MSTHVIAFAPGRVNLIGEHTDYNEGLALPFAIGQGVTVTATALPGRRIEAVARDLSDEDDFLVSEPLPARGWRAFVRGAVAELRNAGLDVPGARVEISATVPPGAGLSSSAALEVALTLALSALAGQPSTDPITLARLCARIESEWVGAQTGLLDQLASLCGRPDHALRIDFRSLAVAPVELDLGAHRLVTLDSGERRANASSGYNRRRAECREACALLGIPSLRTATLQMAQRLPDPLGRRVRHVVSENGRVEDAVKALRGRDVEMLAAVIDASHASLRDGYEVSTPAMEDGVRRLKGAGALGARLIGGGFGGSVLGLLPPDATVPTGAVEVRSGPGARVVAS